MSVRSGNCVTALLFIYALNLDKLFLYDLPIMFDPLSSSQSPIFSHVPSTLFGAFLEILRFVSVNVLLCDRRVAFARLTLRTIRSLRRDGAGLHLQHILVTSLATADPLRVCMMLFLALQSPRTATCRLLLCNRITADVHLKTSLAPLSSRKSPRRTIVACHR